MMTGYIHTVYPRASVSMKMGSPLKTVGVLDTDVSTGVAGRLGKKPDMLPVSIKVRTGRYSEPQTFKVEIVREPNLLASLVMAVLTNAIDTEGDLPDELTARLKARIDLKGHGPIQIEDVLSGARYTGPMGPAAMFSPVASAVSLLTRNPFAQVRIESIDAEVEIARGRTVATIESVRLESDRIEPGQTLRAYATLKPYKGERKVVALALPIPDDFPEGSHEANLCDMVGNLRRRLRNEPQLLEPRDVDGLVTMVRAPTEQKRNAISLHVQLPDKGVAVRGQTLPDLPGSVRAVFAASRQTPEPQVRADLVARVETQWVVEGNQTLKFTVARDAGLTRAEPADR
jgi:hypothetical protein